MGRLFFKYGAMASGKTLHLLALAHQLKENGIPYQLIKPKIDNRDGSTIKSRVGIEQPCSSIGENDSFFEIINKEAKWILIDESQFLKSSQIDELSFIVDNSSINIICYGLRTDFLTNLFEGSKRLFEIADEFNELESYCECGNKNSVNARFNNGKLVTEGEQIEIGGDDKYKSMCRSCYNKLFAQTIDIYEDNNKI